LVSQPLDRRRSKTYLVAAIQHKMRRRSAKNRQSNSVRRSLAPPSFIPDFVTGHVFRFENVAPMSNVTVTQNNLLDLLLMASTASTSQRLVAVFKIKKVEVWGSVGSTFVPVTVNVEFTNTDFVAARRELRSDTSMGLRPAFVSAVPGRDSSARMWQGEGSNRDVLAITCPAWSIIDIHMSVVFRNTESPVAGPVPTGATAGAMYCAPLTGNSAITVPIGWTVLPGV